VTLVSYINTKRVKECWINAIYVGEKIPLEQIFTTEDLSNGTVTWDIELSYFDEEKNKVVVTVHKSTATITIGGDPLNRGHISTGNPATGKNFVGRNRELALLRNHFSDISEIPSLLIRGLRRSGKSSILLRLADELKKNDGLLVAPVDGQSIAGDIRRAFVEKVLDGIRMNYRSNPMCQDTIQTQLIELISIVLYCWLLFVVGKLLFTVAWGVIKIIAAVLLILSLPSLVGCLYLASGIVLLAPAGLLVIAVLLLLADT